MFLNFHSITSLITVTYMVRINLCSFFAIPYISQIDDAFYIKELKTYYQRINSTVRKIRSARMETRTVLKHNVEILLVQKQLKKSKYYRLKLTFCSRYFLLKSTVICTASYVERKFTQFFQCFLLVPLMAPQAHECALDMLNIRQSSSLILSMSDTRLQVPSSRCTLSLHLLCGLPWGLTLSAACCYSFLHCVSIFHHQNMSQPFQQRYQCSNNTCTIPLHFSCAISHP